MPPPIKETASAITPEITMKIPFRITASRPTASARVTRPGLLRTLSPLRTAEDRPGHPLDPVVEPARDLAKLAAEVLDQADALGRHRRPHLGRLGDPLDQPLRLVARQEPGPQVVELLAVERPGQRLLDGGLSQRPRQRLLELRPLQDPHQRPLHGGALGGAHQRLLDRRLGGAIQAGQAGDLACAPRARSEQARRERSGRWLSLTSSDRTLVGGARCS